MTWLPNQHALSGQHIIRPSLSAPNEYCHPSCFTYTPPRNRVVLSEPEFPTVRYFWEAQRRLGAEVVHVPGGEGLTLPLDRMLDEIRLIRSEH